MRPANVTLLAALVFVAAVSTARSAPPSYRQIGEYPRFVLPTRKAKSGPRLMTDARRGWVVKTGAVGSVIQRTTDGGRTWQDRTPPGFASLAPDLGDGYGDVFPAAFGLSALGTRRLWVSFGGVVHGREVLVVERTQDGGRHWRRAMFPGAAEATDLQFLDARYGFLLATGSPAAGKMSKDFYATRDGGRTWAEGGSLGGSLDREHFAYYPSGMTFRTVRDGWITGSTRGEPPVPLIRTRDGGRTWRVQPVDLPAPYEGGAADTDPVRFYGRGQRRGAFAARLMDSRLPSRSVTYTTRDGGEHWRLADVKGKNRR